jgi:hypothetical protein
MKINIIVKCIFSEQINYSLWRYIRGLLKGSKFEIFILRDKRELSLTKSRIYCWYTFAIAGIPNTLFP